jgi:hypothetical protein
MTILTNNGHALSLEQVPQPEENSVFEATGVIVPNFLGIDSKVLDSFLNFHLFA